MTTPKGHSAVMAARHEPPDSLDYFPTPPWATRALCEHLLGPEWFLKDKSVWEPACGEGHMARVLWEYFSDVHSSDIFDYGHGAIYDFTTGLQCMTFSEPPVTNPDWIITNPPFKTAPDFIRLALLEAKIGVAMLVRTQFLEGQTRYHELFSKFPPISIGQFTERVPMHKGKLTATGSTATAYCWLVWHIHRGRSAPQFRWIPPCRKQLERPEDYC